MTPDPDAVEIRVRDNGPYKVTGPVRIVDPEGNEVVPDDPDRPIVLCRCGHSHTKPFCDATHRSSGFESCVRAERVELDTAAGGGAASTRAPRRRAGPDG